MGCGLRTAGLESKLSEGFAKLIQNDSECDYGFGFD